MTVSLLQRMLIRRNKLVESEPENPMIAELNGKIDALTKVLKEVIESERTTASVQKDI